MGRRSSIHALPEDVRRWLERALTSQNHDGLAALEQVLCEQGYHVSKTAIHRFGKKIEQRYARIRNTTEACRLLAEGLADDQDARSEAVIAMVQSELFESILNLQEAQENDTDPSQRIKLLSAAAKNIATLARASVNQKKFRHTVQARVEAAASAAEKIATKGGLSAESVDALRREILGITS